MLGSADYLDSTYIVGEGLLACFSYIMYFFCEYYIKEEDDNAR